MDKLNRTDVEWRARLTPGQRYCINSAALAFAKDDEGEEDAAD